MKLLSKSEALEILDYLERENLLSAQSRVLADIVRDGKCGTTPPDEAAQDPVYRLCLEEEYGENPTDLDADEDDSWNGDTPLPIRVWSFDKIMSYIQISFMPQLAEVEL